jgi:hypothetical protein
MANGERRIELSHRFGTVGMVLMSLFWLAIIVGVLLTSDRNGRPGWTEPGTWLLAATFAAVFGSNVVLAWREFLQRKGRVLHWDEKAIWLLRGGALIWRVDWPDYLGFGPLPKSGFMLRGFEVKRRSCESAILLHLPAGSSTCQTSGIVRRLLELAAPEDGVLPPERVPAKKPSKWWIAFVTAIGIALTAAGIVLKGRWDPETGYLPP